MENSLDIIRLFAALQVATTHYLNLTLVEYGVNGGADTFLLWFKRGLSLFPGVVILFSISGFLMGAALEKQESRGVFLKKRFLRIYPGLWCNILFTAAVILAAVKGAAAHFKTLLAWCAVQGAGLAFTPGFLKEYGAGSINGALWTIMVEVQFYLLIWFFWHFLKKRTDRWWAGLTLFAVVCNLGSWFVKDKALLPEAALSLLDRTFLPYLIWFCIGLLLYRHRERAVPALAKAFPALLSAFVVYKSCWLLLGWQVPGYYADILTSLLLPLAVIGGAYRFGKHRLKREISYGIFLYHWPLINLVFHYGLPEKTGHIPLFLGYTAVYLALAACSAKFVEAPCAGRRKGSA